MITNRVLFLCTGSCYRSRYAEELFNHYTGIEELALRMAYVAGLKDGSNLRGKGLATLVALMSANAGRLAAHLGNALHAAAVRADGPFGRNRASTKA